MIEREREETSWNFNRLMVLVQNPESILAWGLGYTLGVRLHDALNCTVLILCRVCTHDYVCYYYYY